MPPLSRHCDKRHTFVAIWRLSYYEVCRLWRLSHYDVCRIKTFVALWSLSFMTFVALWCLSHYDVCRQLWRLSLTLFVAVSIFPILMSSDLLNCRVCDVFRKNKKVLCRPLSMVKLRCSVIGRAEGRPVIGRRDIKVLCDWLSCNMLSSMLSSI